MKIRICDRCQFRSIAENKICRTCGGTKFTTYDASGSSKVSDENLSPQKDWKSAISGIWKGAEPQLDSD
ncbi:MAG: hypothetical protein IT343_14075 [Candidatus Melainabacteria bacterium]|jgi:hypothetical protein|nr:hypothetical protein [Candidatus Melainabacteria bacterium]